MPSFPGLVEIQPRAEGSKDSRVRVFYSQFLAPFCDISREWYLDNSFCSSFRETQNKGTWKALMSPS